MLRASTSGLLRGMGTWSSGLGWSQESFTVRLRAWMSQHPKGAPLCLGSEGESYALQSGGPGLRLSRAAAQSCVFLFLKLGQGETTLGSHRDEVSVSRATMTHCDLDFLICKMGAVPTS